MGYTVVRMNEVAARRSDPRHRLSGHDRRGGLADIDDLVARVGNEKLRSQLAAALAELRKTRDFGLVFEQHIPETVRLYNHPVRRGIKATLRSSTDKALYLVESIAQGTATVRLVQGDRSTIDPKKRADAFEVPIDDLVAVAEFGDPVYPGLKHIGSIDRGGDRAANVVINGVPACDTRLDMLHGVIQGVEPSL